MRLIDADALEKKYPWIVSRSMKFNLDLAPTIDAAPVVHAKWIYGITLSHEWRKCSKCLVSQEIFGCFTYCPNCGAKMDGDLHDSC